MTTEMDRFLELVECSREERDRRLARLEDEALRDRLRALLVAHGELEDSEPEPFLGRHLPLAPEALLGREIQGLRIVRVVGRGGMGVVFEAEQRVPGRRVALKTLPFMGTRGDGWKRIEHEARLLARLSHRGIAHVYGSGTVSELGGLPYLVMEFIDGEPIDRHATRHALDVRGRLSLLAELCDIVSHAHARGVIHRDLKPANILVDGAGQVRVLDFGIARLIDPEERSLALFTRTGQILGTLPYLSPEQVTGSPDAIDVRVDVYALGVLAYELLAGELPIDVEGQPLATAIRRIVEVEVEPLGVRRRCLRGDIETVVGKALRKDPGQRYGTASEFGGDLRRILDHEPIQARAPSRVYQMRKLVRRHSAFFGSLAAILLALAGGLGWAWHERSLALEARAQALASARLESLRTRSLTRLNGFLGLLLRSAAPQEQGGRSLPVADLVDSLSRDMLSSYADDDYVIANTHVLLGQAARQRHRLEEALEHLERAEATLGDHELTTVEDRIRLLLLRSEIAMGQGSFDEAIAHKREALELARTHPVDPGYVPQVMNELATALARTRRDLEEALEFAESACRFSRETFGEESIVHTGALHALGFVLSQMDRPDSAIDVYRHVVELRRRLLPGSMRLATSLQNLGHALLTAGRREEALAPLEESLALRRSILGDTPHVDLAYGIDNYACLLRDLGRPDEALPLFAEAMGIFDRLLPEDHPDRAICATEWGYAHLATGRFEEAGERLRQALAIHEQSDLPNDPRHAMTLEGLAVCQVETESYAEAIASAQRALEIREAAHGPEHPLVARALLPLAKARLLAGSTDEALEDARRQMRVRANAYGEDHWITWDDVFVLALALTRRGEAREAIELLSGGLSALETRYGPDSTFLLPVLDALTTVVRHVGDGERADALDRRAEALRAR